MKALTLTQPWATLIAIGAKRIETRSWGTAFRGQIAIHAAKGLGPVGGKRGLVEQCEIPAFRNAFMSLDLPSLYGNHENPFPLGAIVALAVLADVRSINLGLRAEVLAQTITPNEIEFGDYSSGRFAWMLEDVLPLKDPVLCSGSLGLWDVQADIAAQVREQLEQEL
jgi:hypothetical protein